MKSDIFTLCDAVQCYENKLMIIGVYDLFCLQALAPAPILINIAARILFDSEECGENMVTIEGKEVATDLKVLELKNQVQVDKREHLKSGILNVALAGIPVMFPRAGEYKFSLTVNGNQLADMILNVIVTS